MTERVLVAKGSRSGSAIANMMRRYAAAQLTLASHRSERLAAGTPERSPVTVHGRPPTSSPG